MMEESAEQLISDILFQKCLLLYGMNTEATNAQSFIRKVWLTVEVEETILRCISISP
jgi:hypothetical protein